MNEILGNLDSLRSAMDTGEFDAIIAMSPENVPYTSGVGIWSQKVIRAVSYTHLTLPTKA